MPIRSMVSSMISLRIIASLSVGAGSAYPLHQVRLARLAAPGIAPAIIILRGWRSNGNSIDIFREAAGVPAGVARTAIRKRSMDTREILVAPGRKVLYLGFEMADDPHALKLYIDGSCYRNPGGPGAYACVVKLPEAWNRDDEPVFALGFHETTNNRMELAACIRAFEHVIEHGYALRVERVIIITDSLYVFDNFNRAPGWRSNGWRNSSGRPVENRSE